MPHLKVSLSIIALLLFPLVGKAITFDISPNELKTLLEEDNLGTITGDSWTTK